MFVLAYDPLIPVADKDGLMVEGAFFYPFGDSHRL